MNTRILKIGAFGMILALTDLGFAAQGPQQALLSPISGKRISDLHAVMSSPTVKKMADEIVSQDNLAARRALLKKRKPIAAGHEKFDHRQRGLGAKT